MVDVYALKGWDPVSLHGISLPPEKKKRGGHQRPAALDEHNYSLTEPNGSPCCPTTKVTQK